MLDNGTGILGSVLTELSLLIEFCLERLLISSLKEERKEKKKDNFIIINVRFVLFKCC